MSYLSFDQLKRQCRYCNASNVINNTNCTEADPVAEAIALEISECKFPPSFQKLEAMRQSLKDLEDGTLLPPLILMTEAD